MEFFNVLILLSLPDDRSYVACDTSEPEKEERFVNLI
jgi:hypothetical protein